MAEESTVERESAPEQEKQGNEKNDPYKAPDDFLASLVRLANNGVEIGVTLVVGGFLLSGIIVGGGRYFNEHLVSSLPKNTPGYEALTEFFTNYGKLYDPLPEESDEEEPITTYIHLREARFFHHAGKPIPGNQPIWWRGRLSEIQGFSMGNLTHETK